MYESIKRWWDSSILQSLYVAQLLTSWCYLYALSEYTYKKIWIGEVR